MKCLEGNSELVELSRRAQRQATLQREWAAAAAKEAERIASNRQQRLLKEQHQRYKLAVKAGIRADGHTIRPIREARVEVDKW